MRVITIFLLIFLALFLLPDKTSGQAINIHQIKPNRLKMYVAEGLKWKNESAQNTNWNKITVTPDGRIWFCGG